jgi:hypothetical protein
LGSQHLPGDGVPSRAIDQDELTRDSGRHQRRGLGLKGCVASGFITGGYQDAGTPEAPVLEALAGDCRRPSPLGSEGKRRRPEAESQQ